MSVPFRFKAGTTGDRKTMAAISANAHHHRSTTRVDHKPFKSRFASRTSLKNQAKGKVERHREERGKRQTPHQQAMSKLARRNQARQLRIYHREKKEEESSIFRGIHAAPKHVAVIPLSAETPIETLVQQLAKAVDATSTLEENGSTRVEVDRFRRSLLFMPGSSSIVEALDVCRIADWVILLVSPDRELGEFEDMLLRAIEGQGITNVTVVIESSEAASNLSKSSSKARKDMSYYFPSLDKTYLQSSTSDCANLMRSLCTATTNGIRWRDERSWMLVENLEWKTEPGVEEPFSECSMTGLVRGKGLNPDRLVHVPGWGDFQVGQITEMPSPNRKRKADQMMTEETQTQHAPTEDNDELATMAPEEVDMTDATSMRATTEHKGVLLDDHHYFSDDDSYLPTPPKRLPKGTSAYQSAWFLDDVSDSDSDAFDEEGDEGDVTMNDQPANGPEDGVFLTNGAQAMTEAGLSEYPESEMHVDAAEDDERRELEEFRAGRKAEAEEDLEFPDEIELHPHVLARERLAKYRGLKSLRTSEWNTEEDLPYQPTDYPRLLHIADYQKSRKAAANEALAGGVAVGTKVRVQLLDVPVSLKQSSRPTSMFSLLRHEHRHTVVNLSMTLHSNLSEPVKSKEELIVQIGPRRFLINPIFSAAGTTPNDVHKFDRFLHPGRSAVATFTGPVTWGAVPVLVFRRVEKPAVGSSNGMTTDDSFQGMPDLKLIGKATTLPPSHSRVVAKRVILTGHPYKIHKKLVTIRYMFFNREDVTWFAALPLWTKRGRQGFIKESLGTHGYFKATFDGKINPMDAVGVSLYKRVWPRPSKPWHG